MLWEPGWVESLQAEARHHKRAHASERAKSMRAPSRRAPVHTARGMSAVCQVKLTTLAWPGPEGLAPWRFLDHRVAFVIDILGRRAFYFRSLISGINVKGFRALGLPPGPWPRSVISRTLKFKGKQKLQRNNLVVLMPPRILFIHCEEAPERNPKGDSLHLTTIIGGVRDQNDGFRPSVAQRRRRGCLTGPTFRVQACGHQSCARRILQGRPSQQPSQHGVCRKKGWPIEANARSATGRQPSVPGSGF